MGWKASLLAAPNWSAGTDSLMAGYADTGKRTDFYSVPMELDSEEIAVAQIPSGALVAVAHAGCEDMASLGLLASMGGEAAEFHLQSTVSFYSYRIFSRSSITEDRSTETEDDQAWGMADDDDPLALLDEEDGLGPTELSEDGLLDRFVKVLGETGWGWGDNLEMAIYSRSKA